MADRDWRAFILAHGRGVPNEYLSMIVGQPAAEIARFKTTVRHARRDQPRAYAELFALRRGRAPEDTEWPAPRRVCGQYEWLENELALLARLVGTMPVPQIAASLTNRLRQVTGDPRAERSRHTVQMAINRRLGLQTSTDLVGGLTTRAAAARVGRVSLINQAIANGALRTFRVGKRHVIPHAEFERWLAARQEPPVGWVRLASLTGPLGISSDSKLPEYATLGYIPDVVKVAGIGTIRGTWYIAPHRAQQIIADARAGRPLPWYGKPLPCNQRAMWRKWQARRREHRGCRRCAAIWRGRAPVTFEAFCARYAALTLSEKRHLTRPRQWRPTVRSRPYGASHVHRDAGVTVYDAARRLQQPSRWVRAWIRRGLLQWGGLVRDDVGGSAVRITPLGICILAAAATEAAAADDGRDWIGVHRAAQHIGVCITTVHKWRASGQVVTKNGPRGLLFERGSLEGRARQYWAWALRRFHRAQPPAWLQQSEAA